jgi:hypothetical protein
VKGGIRGNRGKEGREETNGWRPMTENGRKEEGRTALKEGQGKIPKQETN